MKVRCHRCQANLLHNYDYLLCLNCGTFDEPRRAWDTVGDTQFDQVARAERRANGTVITHKKRAGA